MGPVKSHSAEGFAGRYREPKVLLPCVPESCRASLSGLQHSTAVTPLSLTID